MNSETIDLIRTYEEKCERFLTLPLTLTEQEQNKEEMGICIMWEGGTINGKTQIDKRLVGNIELLIRKQ